MHVRVLPCSFKTFVRVFVFSSCYWGQRWRCWSAPILPGRTLDGVLRPLFVFLLHRAYGGAPVPNGFVHPLFIIPSSAFKKHYLQNQTEVLKWAPHCLDAFQPRFWVNSPGGSNKGSKLIKKSSLRCSWAWRLLWTGFLWQPGVWSNASCWLLCSRKFCCSAWAEAEWGRLGKHS